MKINNASLKVNDVEIKNNSVLASVFLIGLSDWNLQDDKYSSLLFSHKDLPLKLEIMSGLRESNLGNKAKLGYYCKNRAENVFPIAHFFNSENNSFEILNSIKLFIDENIDLVMTDHNKCSQNNNQFVKFQNDANFIINQLDSRFVFVLNQTVNNPSEHECHFQSKIKNTSGVFKRASKSTWSINLDDISSEQLIKILVTISTS